MKLTNSQVESFVNSDTGEVIAQHTKRTFSHGQEAPYIKLYIKDLPYLADIPTRDNQVLYELLRRASYTNPDDGLVLYVNSALKRQIASSLNVKNVGTISNAITELVNGKVLIRLDVGYYSFNPYFFGRGSWQDIDSARQHVNYEDINGKTFLQVVNETKAISKKLKDIKEDEKNG